MSEPMFPTASAEEIPVVESAPEQKSNRTALLAVGGAVAALAVGAGAFFLLTGSGSGGGDAAAPVVAKPAASAPVAPAASPSKAAAPVKTVVVAGRDPFAVLFPAPAAGSGTTSGSGSSTTATDPSPAPSVASQSQTTTSTLILTAVDAKKGTATVAIDGKRYSAVIGTPFATYYQLYAVFNAKCAGFLVGDVSVPVCIGTAASVTH